MTRRQITLLAAILVAAVGVGIHKERQAATLRTQMASLQQKAVPLPQQIQQLTSELDEVTQQVALQRDENQRLIPGNSELPRLRGEVSRLRRETREFAQLKTTADAMSDPANKWSNRADQLKQLVEQRPELKIPEFQFLTEEDWLRFGDPGWPNNTEDGIRRAMAHLRGIAKSHIFSDVAAALDRYVIANNGQLPNDILQLKPYLNSTVEDSLLQRYKLLHTGKLSDFPESEVLLTEKAPVDDEYDIISSATAYGGSFRGIGKLAGDGGSWMMPTNLTAQLKPYAR